MAVLQAFGAESGDTAELLWNGSIGGGTYAVDNSIHTPAGAFSYKVGDNSGTNVSFTNLAQNLSGQTTMFCRTWFRTNWAPGVANNTLLILTLNSSGGRVLPVHLLYDGTNYQLQLMNTGDTAQTGSNFRISLNTFYCLEVKAVVSATVGELHLKVNGVEVAGGTGLNTGTLGISNLQLNMFGLTGTGGSGFCWFDDVILGTDGYYGLGYQIARQPTATTPFYNAWTKNGGANIAACWNSTPFNAATNITDNSNAVNKQSGFYDFSTTGGTGTTGFGTGTITSGATINTFKAALVGKTSSTTSDGVDNVTIRSSGNDGPGGGLAFPWTVSDSYQETFVPSGNFTGGLTPAVLANFEMVVIKGTGTNTHQLEDGWSIVDYVPPPTALPPRFLSRRRKIIVPLKMQPMPPIKWV